MVCADRKRVMVSSLRPALLQGAAAAAFLTLAACSVFGGGPAPTIAQAPANVAGSGAVVGQAATTAPGTTPPVTEEIPIIARPGWLQGVFGTPLAVPGDPGAPRLAPGIVAASCPNVEVRDGTETLRTFRAGAGEAAEALVWQATLGKLARECRTLGPDDNFAGSYRVGAIGRLLLGPSGAPGIYQIPVRIAIVRGDNVLDSRLTQVSVSIPPNEAQASFSVVIDNFKITRDPSDKLSDLQIFVGFDPAPPPAAPKTARKSRARS